MDKYTENIIVSSGKYTDERKYWLDHIGEGIDPSRFPCVDDTGAIHKEIKITSYNYQFSKGLSNEIYSVCNYSDYGAFIILVTAVLYLLYEYTETEDTLVGVPLLNDGNCQEYTNDLLAIRNHINIEGSFKDYVNVVKDTLNKAYNNQTFPLSYIFETLGLPLDDGKPIFKTILLMDNIHNKQCLNDDRDSMIFEFSKKGSDLLLNLKYNEHSYKEESVKEIIKLLSEYLRVVVQNPSIVLKDVDIMSEVEKAEHRKIIEIARLNSVDREFISEKENGTVEYLAPRNDVEAEMAALWSEVLGVEKVGITNNFFSLGGDSIKAIRLAAMLWKYGVRVRDLYTYPTIAELADNIKTVENTINQEPVEGEVILTPIQRWFFKKVLTNQSHYNQSVFIYKKEGFNVDTVREVFIGIIEHHDVLRMTYTFDGDSVKQYNHGLEKTEVDIAVINLSQDQNYQSRVAEEANKAHIEINIEKGPILKLVLFKCPDGDHLLIIIHHLIVDGISWRILLEDFAKAYVQRINGEDIGFPQKTSSYKDWAEKLLQYAQSDKLQKEKEYWESIVRADINSMPRRHKTSMDKVKFIKDQSVILSEEETEKVKNASNTLNISMEGILLSAIGLSFKKCTGVDKLLVDLEGHGRQDIDNDINITRTVGWFTSLYPVILDSGSEVYIDCLKKVNDMLKGLPNKGFGYSVLKFLTTDTQTNPINLDFKADVCFNYLGEFDQDINTELFSISHLFSGKAVCEENPVVYSFDINSIIIENKLRVNINYNQYQYAEQEVAVFAEACKQYIVEIIHYVAVQQSIYNSLQEKKVLSGIEPFNEVFYKDCFYNSFFAVAKYLGRNTDLFFANDTFIYSDRDDKNPLNIDVEYIVSEGLNSTIEKCGIKTNTVVSTNDIIRNIKMAIANDRPAIVRVDCFYESIRIDTYQKRHWPHMLLIYGYDDTEKVFNIIEHSDINGLDYSKKTISYQNIIQCYNGLLSNFLVGDSYPTFLEFYIEESNYKNEYENLYSSILAHNMLKNRDILLKRLERVKTFADDVSKIIFDEKELSASIDNLSFSLTNMLKIKYTEAYRISKLLKDDSGINETMDTIIELLKLTKNILDKYKLSRIYREKSLTTVNNNLKRLYDLEYKYYNGLLTILENQI